MDEKQVELLVLHEMDDHVISVLQSDQENPFPFDDNGGEPDGPSWYVPTLDLSPEVVSALLANHLGYTTTGYAVAYSGTTDEQDQLNAQYPHRWCAYSSRNIAYRRR